MNGYQEDGTAKPLSLGTPPTELIPFISPYNINDQYRVVGSASTGDVGKIPDIWHYREGANGCFIDAYRPSDTMRYRSFTAYAASYVEAAEYRLAWQNLQ